MAGAKSGVHVSQLKPIVVSDNLIKGNKFIKWDDDSIIGTPVTLKVDPKGYIMFWKDQNKEMDCLEISMIKDTRTGKYARSPKEGKLRDSCTMGARDVALEDKTVSICYGTDHISVQWINFTCNSKECAMEWAECVLEYSRSPLSNNANALTYLEKTHVKISSVLNAEGKISVKNVLKTFAQQREDRKRVEKALEAAGLPHGKNDCINPNKFTFNDMYNVYRHLTIRSDIDQIFDKIGAKKRPYLTLEQFMELINKTQRDPRLNEVLYPYMSQSQVQEIINKFEFNRSMAQKGHISRDGFLRYLMSDENNLIPDERLDLSMDMNRPLSHYFINSSHNTYLTENQLTGKSSVEMYRQVLLSGCRCIELDCWDGKGADEEPMITHGYTMCTEISFKEVIEAIAESAFKTSEYPVILSFENHCTLKQQAKMAAYCRSIFGDMLVTEPLEGYPLKPDSSLPSPEMLKRKILVKNKKKHKAKVPDPVVANQKNGITVTSALVNSSSPGVPNGEVKKQSSLDTDQTMKNGDDTSADGELESDSDSDSDDDDIAGLTEEEEKRRQRMKKEKGTAGSEAEAGQEMSDLVNYITPVHFHSFDISEKRNRSFEVSSFVETQALALLKEFPVDFVNYNKRQMSRIYPRGTRVDSSNYMPQVYWNAGCQLVALNFQVLDLAMQLNIGIFEWNRGTGYLLKPDFMCRQDRQFDPFAESTVDGIIAASVTLKVLSGQFLTEKRVGTYVEVEMYGLPTDTVRKRRTKVVPLNGINPVYDDEPFSFKKVVLPHLALIRVSAYEETGRMIGHRILPIEGLRPGYRHIPLRNALNQPLNLPTLFVHLSVKDYVPDAFEDFAAALANPIAYQSMLEKHSKQLEVLMEDFDVESNNAQAGVQDDNVETSTSIPPSNFTKKRTDSLMSKTDSVVSASSTEGKNGLNRKGSKHAVLSQQESTGSALSQSSSTGSTPAGATHQDVTKILSGTESSAQLSTASFLGTTKLANPEMSAAISLEELKQQRPFLKYRLKMKKEIEKLQKKHQKAKQNMQDVHRTIEQKLLVSHFKAVRSMEKKHRKILKKAGRNGSLENLQPSLDQQLNQLKDAQKRERAEMKRIHSEDLIELSQSHFQLELDSVRALDKPMYDLMDQILQTSLDDRLEMLRDIHEDEVDLLKKRLAQQNREEIKALQKKHKDKQELSRVKRENQHKHITMAVAEREKLKGLLEKRVTEVKENHEAVKKTLAEERQKRNEDLQQDYEDKCLKIEQEYREWYRWKSMEILSTLSIADSVDDLTSDDESTTQLLSVKPL